MNVSIKLTQASQGEGKCGIYNNYSGVTVITKKKYGDFMWLLNIDVILKQATCAFYLVDFFPYEEATTFINTL